ncbi:MAG: GCN5-related N-acetyltransferase [Acidimicrobiales bacterium]|nr:GCN5-related N-acetyltransferase [Acidimicrobiales bacterium]
MELAEQVTIVQVVAEATHAVRREVLRGHAPDLGVSGPADDDPAAIHLAASVDGEVVGVVSGSPVEGPLNGGPGSWQLSSMAVREPWRAHGIGAALLTRLVDEVTEQGGRLIWARARDSALGFYERHGFRTIGDGFDHARLPHHYVVRAVGEGLDGITIRLIAARPFGP